MRRRVSLTVMLVAGILSTAGCGLGDFNPPSLVDSVRILASSADEPYAKPGDTVNLTVLAADGRTDKSQPMVLYWIPEACINPKEDAYYECFASFGARSGTGSGAGSGSGTGLGFKPGVDLTPFLPQGPSYSITLPQDIISSHAPVKGAEPYGLAIVFNVACAGHLELLTLAPGDVNPQSVPIGCFDASENQLGPDDYVFGFTRVYAYTDRTNANPVIDHLTFQGATIDPTAGITMPHCTGGNDSACDNLAVDVFVPSSSDELNPDDVSPDGTPHREQVWADYYVTTGTLESDAILLYDAVAGQLPDNPNHYQAPSMPVEGTMWVVVHDNRDGASWVELPIHVQ
jgi:hypothetical protein